MKPNPMTKAIVLPTFIIAYLYDRCPTARHRERNTFSKWRGGGREKIGRESKKSEMREILDFRHSTPSYVAAVRKSSLSNKTHRHTVSANLAEGGRKTSLMRLEDDFGVNILSVSK